MLSMISRCLLVCCAALTLVGCRALPGAGEPITITFACPDHMMDHYRPLAERYSERNRGVTVQVQSAESLTGHGPGQSSSEDVARIAHGADTFVANVETLNARPPQGLLLDLADLADADEGFERDDFYPAALALVEGDGHLWGLPAEVDPQVLYYRPSAFREAGLNAPSVGWSWEEWLDAARQLTEREEQVVSRYGFVDPWPGFTLAALATQRAGDLIDARDGMMLPGLDAPGVAEALAWYADLSRVHGVMPDPATTDYAAVDRIIDAGKAAMWSDRSGMWEQYSLRTDGDVALAPLPEAGPAAAWVRGEAYLVSAGSAHPDEAWAWLVYLTRQSPPTYSRAVPARRSVADEIGYWKEIGAGGEALTYSLEHGFTHPSAVWVGLQRALLRTLGGESPEAALAEAQESLAKALAQMGRAEAAPPTPAPVKALRATPDPRRSTIRFSASTGAELGPYRSLAQAFERENPEIAVEIVSGGASLGELAAEADCFAAPALALVGEGAEALRALDPFVEAAGSVTEPYPAGLLAQGRVGDALYGLPLEVDGALLYYHRALLDGAGWTAPSSAWRADDLVATAVGMSDREGATPRFGYWPRGGAFTTLGEHLAWLGATLYDAEGHPSFDAEATVEAFTTYAGLVGEAMPSDAVARRPVRAGAWVTSIGMHPGPVADGEVALWTDTVGNHRAAPPLSFDVGVAPLPAGAAPLVPRAVDALFISASSPHPEECWHWITYLAAHPDAVQLLPARRDVVESDDWRERVGEETAVAWEVELDRLERAADAPGVSPMAFELTWLDGALLEVLAGDDPRSALARAQDRAAAYDACVRATPLAWRGCAQDVDPDVLVPPE